MFPLNALSRKALRQIRGDAAELRRDFERSAADDIDRPWMKVTGRYSGNGLYAWTMQAIDTDGNFYDHPNGVAGTVAGLSGATATVLPAREMSDTVVSSFPFYVRGERAIGGGVTGGVVYRFAAPGSSGATRFDSMVGVPTVALPVGVATTIVTYPFTTTGYYLMIPQVTVLVTLSGAFTFMSWGLTANVTFASGTGAYFGASTLLQQWGGGTDTITTGYGWTQPIGPSFVVRVDTVPASIALSVTPTSGTCNFTISPPYGGSPYGNVFTGIKLSS